MHSVKPLVIPSALVTPEQGSGELDCELLCAPAAEVERGDLRCAEDGQRDIEQIKIARRCEGMNQATHARLAIPEQGAGGLDCKLLCAPAA